MRRFRAFMEGRYGLDQLGFALILLGCLVTMLLSLFRLTFYASDFYRFQLYRLPGAVLLFLAAWRVLSRNFEKRRQENAHFLKLFSPLLQKARVWWTHQSDRTHRYFSCPTCRRTLRVPKNRGKIEITCPHCGRKFKRRT